MSKGIEIVDWDRLYEVNDHNQAWKPGDKYRVGSLTYIRLKCNGRLLGVGYRKLLKIAGKKKAMEVFGIFAKLLEIAGDAPGGKRGIVWSDPETEIPATIEDISYILDIPIIQIQKAVEVLSNPHLQWIKADSLLLREFPEIPYSDTDTDTDTDTEDIFENFRKLYPGKKRGLDTEYKNFKGKHSDWKDVVYILYTSLEQQITQKKKDKADNKFVPEWPHLQTYINNRRWEEVDGSVLTVEQRAERVNAKAEAKYQEYKAEQSQWLLELTVEQIKNYPTKSTNFLRLVKELRPEAQNEQGLQN